MRKKFLGGEGVNRYFNEMEEKELIAKVVSYFDETIFQKHIEACMSKHSKLKSYNVNPIVVRYLSHLLEDKFSAKGVAKALFLPRILGTSINTSFGTRIQNMFVELNMASGSLIKGMDIEFEDRVDGLHKWCQLKSGPNTINSEDVNPLVKNFSSTIALARTNSAMQGISNSDFIVGIVYGEKTEISQHYRRIDEVHPVFIGTEFWHRITGFPAFYSLLVEALQDKIDTLNTQTVIQEGIRRLSLEIETSELFSFDA